MNDRVLVIEDDPASLELIGYLLSESGYEVSTATRGDEGLALAIEAVPDLVLCDIQLPGIDGYSVAQALRKDRRFDDVPLIAITALAMVGDRERVLAAGFSHYMSKPIEPKVFLSRLRAILATAGNHARARATRG